MRRPDLRGYIKRLERSMLDETHGWLVLEDRFTCDDVRIECDAQRTMVLLEHLFGGTISENATLIEDGGYKDKYIAYGLNEDDELDWIAPVRIVYDPNDPANKALPDRGKNYDRNQRRKEARRERKRIQKEAVSSQTEIHNDE